MVRFSPRPSLHQVRADDVAFDEERTGPAMTDVGHSESEIILYLTEDGRTRVQCRFEGEMVWLTRAQIAELFQTTSQDITVHLKAIDQDGELDEAATCKAYVQVRREGGRQVTRGLRDEAELGPQATIRRYRVVQTAGSSRREAPC